MMPVLERRSSSSNLAGLIAAELGRPRAGHLVLLVREPMRGVSLCRFSAMVMLRTTQVHLRGLTTSWDRDRDRDEAEWGRMALPVRRVDRSMRGLGEHKWGMDTSLRGNQL